MADATTERNRDDEVSAEKKLDDLYELIDGIEIAMFTTRRPDGHLVSRAMATQQRTAGADLWFVTDVNTHKLDELVFDPHVNVSYFRDRTMEWVSVSGTATISQDRAKIHELYAPDWRAWFGDEGGERNGGPDDPRLALVLVEAHSVTYQKVNVPRPVLLFQVAKAIVTGTPPKTSEVREIGTEELHRD